jgi:hypothetical protein
MTKVIFVFTGVFVGAVVYELIARANSGLTKKAEDIARKKIDGISSESHPSFQLSKNSKASKLLGTQNRLTNAD